MGQSGWREVRFAGGRLDGRVQMVTAGPAGLLAAEIRIEVQAGRHEVYALLADDISPSAPWAYRNPRYVLQN